MTNTLQRVDSSAAAKRMAQILDEDGALIVTDALTPQQLRRINSEVGEMMQATAPGLRHPQRTITSTSTAPRPFDATVCLPYRPRS